LWVALICVLFFCMTGFASVNDYRGTGFPNASQADGESSVQVPIPYLAMRADYAPDSTDTGAPQPVGPRTTINYRPVLMSALLPGSGQLYQGQNRGYLYIAAEVASITGWALFRNKGNDTREEFIDFAWVNARENVSSQNLRGDDDYYEHLARWDRSGVFSKDPNYDIDDPFTILPEDDPGTWNGEQWRIASINHFEPDSTGAYTIGSRADSLAALQQYSGRAYEEQFYWDWTGQVQGELRDNYRALQNQYLDLRDDSNLAFQRATASLVLLMANHVISVVDAFISAKVELPGGDGDNRTKLNMRLKGGLKSFPGASVKLTHEF
jgi:hypothetical protein